MIREYRYTVLKNKDIEKAVRSGWITEADFYSLTNIVDKVNRCREQRDKDPLECVVVESDWPEFEPVWNMIESRVFAQESYL